MKAFDFTASAELYLVSGRRGRPKQMTYRRFASAAIAIRHVVEELAQTRRAGSVLEIDEIRYYYREIHALYQRSDYPLRRIAGETSHGDEAKLSVRAVRAGQGEGAKEGGEAAGQD